MTLDLFRKPSVRIQRIDDSHARRESDGLKSLTDRLRQHEDYYPEIGRWIDRKVIPGLKSGDRTAYVGYREESVILAAVLKQGMRSKFCHLSIQDGFRGDHLGQLMFALMAAEVRHSAKEIHFTLPEGLWQQEKGFFQAFGFTGARPAPQQYRGFEDELRCSARFEVVWKNVLSMLPTLLTTSAISGYELNDGVVLSVHDEYAKAIMHREKTVEVRRRFSTRWTGRKASVYATGNTQLLLGTVEIAEVVKAPPEEVWQRFGPKIGCEYAEFEEYCGDRPQVFALRLTEPQPYEAPIPLSELSHLIGEALTPPQSYNAVSSSNVWGRALSVAALLHRKITAPRTQSHTHPL